MYIGVSQVAIVVKNPPVKARDEGLIPGLGRSPGGEEGTATHSNIKPGEAHGQRSLEGYSSQGFKESHVTEAT